MFLFRFKYKALLIKVVWWKLMYRILIFVINCVNFGLVLVVCWGFWLIGWWFCFSRCHLSFSSLFDTSYIFIVLKNLITFRCNNLRPVHKFIRRVGFIHYCSVSFMMRRFVDEMRWSVYFRVLFIHDFSVHWTFLSNSFIIFFHVVCIYWKVGIWMASAYFRIVPVFLALLYIFLSTGFS